MRRISNRTRCRCNHAGHSRAITFRASGTFHHSVDVLGLPDARAAYAKADTKNLGLPESKGSQSRSKTIAYQTNRISK